MPVQTQRQVVQTRAVERLSEAALSGAHQRHRQRSPVHQEVVDEGVRDRIVVEVFDAMAEALKQGGGPQRVVPHGRAAVPSYRPSDNGDPQPISTGSGDGADGRQGPVAPDAFALAKERRGVAHRTGQHAVIDQSHRHLPGHLVQRKPAAGGLETHETVAGRGDPDGPAAVVGVRDRHHTGGDEGPRPRG